MELATYSNAELWRMMLPSSHILFPHMTPPDELIFTYRKWVLFVYSDGSTIRIPRPHNLKDLTYDQLWELLFFSKEIYDYDHEGIYDIGEIMMDIGFMVTTKKNYLSNYLIEIASSNEPSITAYSLKCENVDFPFAIYRGLLKCTELYHQSQKEQEYLIQRVTSDFDSHNLKLESQ